MRKPNYRFERIERDRLKQAKKQEKLKRQQERLAEQKGGEPDESGSSPAGDTLDGDPHAASDRPRIGH